MSTPAYFRIQGWDPLLIVSQIVAIQTLHYLSLCVLLPPLLLVLADSQALVVEGGPANVAMVMDWRELLSAGSLDVAYDPSRVWTIAGSWFVASLIDAVYLYHIVRRPASILDFSLTLFLNHVLLTTYYSASFPTSFLFWIVLASSSLVQIILAEQLCIRREMNTHFDPDPQAFVNRSSLSHIWPVNQLLSSSTKSTLSSTSNYNNNNSSSSNGNDNDNDNNYEPLMVDSDDVDQQISIPLNQRQPRRS